MDVTVAEAEGAGERTVPDIRRAVILYYMAVALQSGGCLLALARTLRLFDAVPLILALGYLVDLLFVGVVLRNRLPLRPARSVLLAGAVVLLALSLGFLNFQFTRSLVTESLLYGLFLLKIVIFSHLFGDRDHRALFVRFLGVYAVVAVLFAVIGVGALMALSSTVPGIYFNLTPQLLFPFIWSMATGGQPMAMFILVVALMAGKRMIILGLLLALALGFRRWMLHPRGLASLGMLVALAALGSGLLVEFSPGAKKSVATSVTLSQALVGGTDESTGWADPPVGPVGALLRRIDRHRYYDARSAVAGMTPLEMVVGRGFGYRYEWMHVDIGVTFAVPHFTPAGLFMKFGAVGTVAWVFLFGGALYAGWRHKSEPLVFACLVFLTCLIVQSLFAYVLFANPLTAIAIGYLFARERESAVT
ncbi:MAG: hypothetical protein HQK87_11615 [Nitrospinae bacterium]|nr:hypothetical protein [Nitrospinota bacterium]